jgi:hypothetical protein
MKTTIHAITVICLILNCSAQTAQNQKDEYFKISDQQPDFDALNELRNVIEAANTDMKQISLIIVNQGDNEHLMINNKKVKKNVLKEYFIDLSKTCKDKLPVILIDCADQSKNVFDLIAPLAESYLIENVVINFADARRPIEKVESSSLSNR